MSTNQSMTTDREFDDRFDADELGQYRSLSSLAVVSLVLGLCSALMFASPLMVVVPLAAAATGLLALKAIAATDSGLSGARLARLGLALALLFTVASSARVKVRDLLLQRQADRVGQQWLELASQGRVDEMLDYMTKPAAEKLMPQTEPGQPRSFFSGMLASALMRQDPLVLSLKNLASSGELRFDVEEAEVFSASQPAQVALHYRAAGGTEQAACSVVLKRFRASLKEQVWLIDTWAAE